jgi:hypothetical protein
MRLDLEELATLIGPAVVEAVARQAYKRALEYDAEWLHGRLWENEARLLLECCPPWSLEVARHVREIAERAFGPDHRITRLLVGWERCMPPLPANPTAPWPSPSERDEIRPDWYSLQASEVAAILTELTRDEDARKGREGR